MKISVITINRNNLNGLQKTMQSVFSQTYEPIEYIVIDGGSTDGSREYIEEHSLKLAYWVSESDKGIYNAMNKGIEKATGDYVLFLNSGDFLFNELVIEDVFHKKVLDDFIYGNMIKEMNDGTYLVDKGPEKQKINLNTFVEGTLNHSSTFIKLNLFKKFGLYDEKLKIVSDWKLFLIAIGINNCSVRYNALNISVFDMNGISNSNIKLRNLERKKVLRELLGTEKNSLKGRIFAYSKFILLKWKKL